MTARILKYMLVFFMLPHHLFAEDREFRVGFPYVTPQLDPGKVQTAEQYILLIHLLRSLTSYSNTGDLVGDLAESWQISKDFREYKFVLKKGQKYSNGDEITSKEAADTIRRRMKQNYAVHYDFSKISEVIAPSKYELVIKLNTPDPFLMYELDHPEFRPLHGTDLIESVSTPEFKVASGAYFLTGRTFNSYSLDANSYFSGGAEGPKKVSMVYLNKSSDPKLDPEAFIKSDFDLIWSPRAADTQKLLNLGYLASKPRLGFTFFVSMNPNTLDIGNRRFIQNLIDPSRFDYSDRIRNSNAYQLYLPNGPGRISDDDVGKTWKTIKATKAPKTLHTQLSILMPKKFDNSEKMKKFLEDGGYKISVTEYDTYEKYADYIRSTTFDLVIANNDYSSIDLRGNIAVTFNKERPLILLNKSKSKAQDLIDAIVIETDANKRNAKIKDLGALLLTEAYIVPLFYSDVVVLAKKDIDLSAWSQIVPEIGIWKLTKLKP